MVRFASESFSIVRGRRRNLTKLQTILLAVTLIFIGSLWVYNKVSDKDPEPAKKNAGMCPDCGQILPQKDGVCSRCEAKKNREKLEAAARGGAASPPKEEPRDTGRLILAASAAGVLLCVAFWPRINRLLRQRSEDDEIDYMTFNCFRCRRKLRFRATLAGTQGMCPGCKEVCTFPNTEPKRID
jgi:hypothetical protein